ncbi:uncharacterized protein C8R40DRAFT_880329 [Lentinula edodes]|uniref:uncharacterized protein n=1 Tax=Lentinula edodes TaxID=5353 RepID=UPI001E8CE9B0|nr:uncharacterized protein C8R40DRAFT_880329 [Lentinula edodes]KAH7878001.1 hypothetical protein C8R40DRAFT_880329 [Lentinula edodes]
MEYWDLLKNMLAGWIRASGACPTIKNDQSESTHICSQTISILSPTAGAEIVPGQDVTVQLAFANSLTGVEHVAAVVAMINCAGAPCPADASDTLGIPLFAGNYTPQYHEQNLPPYENYTVTVSSTLAVGTNMLTVAHFMLVGVSVLYCQGCSPGMNILLLYIGLCGSGVRVRQRHSVNAVLKYS